MLRKCEICSADNKNYIYTQKFILPEEQNIYKFNIVACRECGFIFADNIPSQEEYDIYYKNNNKYTYSNNIPDGLKKTYHEVFFHLDELLKNKISDLNKNAFKIIDIGCSTGYILNLFKNAGYTNLRGLETSQTCSAIGRELYGIDIFQESIFKFKNKEKFDLIIMTGVLEHIYELNRVMLCVTDLLNINGILFILVPDTENFSGDPYCPFDEFSFEHINYFTGRTIENLMRNHYLKKNYLKSLGSNFYDSANIISCFNKTDEKMEIEPDKSGILKINNYISASRKKLKILEEKIDELVNSKEKIIVWGVGSLTFRLLASTNLSKTDIKYFTDSNIEMHQKKIMGIEIVSPNFFNDKDLNNYTVFIASYIYGDEIRNVLLNHYKFKGKIIGINFNE